MSKSFSVIAKLSIAILFLFTANGFGQNDLLKSDLNKSLKKFDVVSVNNQDAMQSVVANKSLKINTSEKSYELRLEPRDLRSRRYRAENTGSNGVRRQTRKAAKTYKGFVKGDANSKVRISIGEDKIEGYFVSNGEMFFIEPAKRYSQKADKSDLVVYRKGDHLNERGVDCRSSLAEKINSGTRFLASKSANLTASGVIELATEADFEFVNLFSSEIDPAAAAIEDILGILNMTEGVYEEELNLTIEVVFQHTWSVADPFSGTNSETLNTSFQNYWNLNRPTTEVPRDSAHLFTAKSYSMSQGYSYIGAICSNPMAAYGVSGRINPAWNWHFGDFLVTTHEIAHNLNAEHAETSQGCGNTVMNASLGGSTALSFCELSRNEIGSFVSINGGCLAPPVASLSTQFDFDGDAKTEVAIYRPSLGQWWFLRSVDGQNRAFQFGTETDTMVPADYTGDGITDIAFWRESTGEVFVLRSEDSSFYSFPFGSSGDIPVPADFDGDSVDDFAVFRPSTTTWYILNSTDGISIRSFGADGDIPVVNDYDGDGKADIAIFRPGSYQWWINGSTSGVNAMQFGAEGDKPTSADFTGDGKADIALYRPASGEWFIVRSEDSSFYSVPFGIDGDVPVPGDYDGDGKADTAVWRPSNKTWYISGSQNGFSAIGFGSAGDVPVPASFIR